MNVLLESVALSPDNSSLKYVLRYPDGSLIEKESQVSNTRGIVGLHGLSAALDAIGKTYLAGFLADALFAVMDGTPPAFPYDLEAASLKHPQQLLSKRNSVGN